jgi:hypothetical protein
MTKEFPNVQMSNGARFGHFPTWRLGEMKEMAGDPGVLAG